MKNIVAIILTAIFTYVLWYLTMPTFAVGFANKWFLLIFALVIGGVMFFDGIPESISELTKGSKVCFTGVLIVLAGLIVIPIFTTWSAFHASSYQALLGSVENRTITSDMSPINPENVIVIDQQTAHRLADKKISDEDRALGSQVELGEITLQKVGDKMYYVIPLLHSGFFKYWSNGTQGTPGYVMVNAINDKDVKLVKNVNGKPIHIVYQPGAFFSKQLERHVYMNGYMTQGFTDPCFEIDDSGRPYYVYSLYEKTVGMSGSNTIGSLIVDVETGEIKKYGVDDAPAWVDRTQPEQIVANQINDWGYYVNGWLNPSDKDRLSMSSDLVLVYGDDGRCYFYAGLTSVGKNGSSVGFMLIDSRNKKVAYYKQGGATEEGAMTSAQGKWQEKGYNATHPRPYNIDGVWTYVMALKDNEGLVKAVAMVSVAQYEIVGVGETIKDALRDYKSALNGSGNSLVAGHKQAETEFNATIARISMDLKQGNSYYYFTVDSIKDKIFVITSDVSEEITLTQQGDKVHIGFDENGGSTIDVNLFDNLLLKLTKSKEQEKVEKYFKGVNDTLKAQQNSHDSQVINTAWDSLSPSEKKKALENLNKK
jgi:hypothetical protein